MKRHKAFASFVLAASFLTVVSAAALAADPVNVLNGLIETARNGEEGYRVAAGGVQDAATQALFTKYSAQRAEFAAELKNQVRALGGDPDKGGSALGAAHRGWINIKAVATGKDSAGILAECKRGDESAVKSYEDALHEGLPAEVQTTVQKQLGAIREAYDKVVALEAKKEIAKDVKDTEKDLRNAEEKASRNVAEARDDFNDAKRKSDRKVEDAEEKAARDRREAEIKAENKVAEAKNDIR
jgi:uncharacterized protein (TIGR02284 family)